MDAYNMILIKMKILIQCLRWEPRFCSSNEFLDYVAAVSLWSTIRVARQYMLGTFAWGFAQVDSGTHMPLRTVK